MRNEVFPAGDSKCVVDEVGRVGRRHVGKPRAQPFVVDADERVITDEVNMIFDDHQITGAILRVEAAAGISDDEHLRAQPFEHADREGDL